MQTVLRLKRFTGITHFSLSLPPFTVAAVSHTKFGNFGTPPAFGCLGFFLQKLNIIM